MATIHGSSGRVFVQSGASQALTNQVAAHVAGSGYTRYQVGATYRYLDPTAPIVVQKSTDGGATWPTTVTTGFEIEHAGGFIAFASAQGASDQFRLASGKYFTMAEWGGLINWKLDISRDLQDITTFGNGFKLSMPGLGEISGSLEGYWADNAQLTTIAAGTLVMLALYADYGTPKARYEGYGYLKKDAIETAVDAVIKESIDFQLNRVWYHAG